MPIVTTVRFAHERGALAHTLEVLPEADVRVVRDTGTDPEHDMYIFRFGGGEWEEIEGALEEDPSVAEWYLMPEYENEHLLGIEFTSETKLLAPKLTEAQGFSIEARRSAPGTGGFGWRERWLLPDREALNTVWESAREEGFDFEILTLRRFSSRETEVGDNLTAQQEETLLMAYREGYFDEPREISLEELADLLDLSPTAVGGRLRRGMKALVEATLADENAE